MTCEPVRCRMQLQYSRNLERTIQYEAIYSTNH